MIAHRYVFANPRYVCGHPGRVLPDLEIDGGDAALAFTADDDTIVGVFTAQGIASVAEVILRYLVKSGEEEIARKALEQVLLEMSDESKPAKVIVPKNTITRAKLLPPGAK